MTTPPNATSQDRSAMPGVRQGLVSVLMVTALMMHGASVADASGNTHWVLVKNLMSSDRSNASAALLTDGRVLVAGGVGSAPWTADVYDPRTKSFTPTPDMHDARSAFDLIP